jgi:hypothetical protein
MSSFNGALVSHNSGTDGQGKARTCVYTHICTHTQIYQNLSGNEHILNKCNGSDLSPERGKSFHNNIQVQPFFFIAMKKHLANQSESVINLSYPFNRSTEREM